MYENYGKRVDEIARKAFAEISEVESAFVEAENRHKRLPQNPNGRRVDDEYIANSAKAQADFIRARDKRNDLRRSLPDTVQRSVSAIRAELVQEVWNRNRAKPGEIDHDTLALLNSGICTVDDLEALMQEAKTQTMRRMIAAAAGKAAAAETDRDAATRLRVLSQAANRENGSSSIQAFDNLVDTLNRSIANPSMIRYWDSLTAPMIDSM